MNPKNIAFEMATAKGILIAFTGTARGEFYLDLGLLGKTDLDAFQKAINKERKRRRKEKESLMVKPATKGKENAPD